MPLRPVKPTPRLEPRLRWCFAWSQSGLIPRMTNPTTTTGTLWCRVPVVAYFNPDLIGTLTLGTILRPQSRRRHSGLIADSCRLTSAWTSRGAAVGWCMFETTRPARARSGDLAAAPQVMRGR